MLFNSAEFIFLFLPVVVCVFFYLSQRRNNEAAILWLVVSSLFFYGWWDPKYLLIIVGSMLANYYFGQILYGSRNKTLLFFGVVGNLAVLGYYKYAGFVVFNIALLTSSDFSIDSIVLPLAISFFTFQQIAYLVDCYKRITEEYRFIHYALFVTFFPQLIAGPIVHHKDMLPQFNADRPFSLDVSDLVVGLSIFSIGLFKKTVIADSLAGYANTVFVLVDGGGNPDFFLAWSGALAYSLQLYFDFSGYSDMALGLARIFGVRLPLNFYSPYKALSITEFWRRWHITLSRFLRDYVYIPLGGNRKGPNLRFVFLLLTMLLGGLWHGAGWNFIIWGGLHGSYLVINNGWRYLADSRPLMKMPKPLSWLITMLAVIVAWVFFRATTLDGAIILLQGMFGINGFAIPNAILARLGEFGVFLQSLGVTTYHGGASQLVFAWLYCLILIPAVVVLPNVQDVFRGYQPSLSSIGMEDKSAYWPVYSTAKKLVWAPSRFWAIYCSLLLVAGLMTLGQISDFLYFQF